MSSVSSSFPGVPRRQYIATDNFYRSIFQYSTYIDPTLATRGRLIVHPGAVDPKCPSGSILRENGKKLHSGTHPDLVDPNTSLPYTYLVGVYDVVSGLSGFINPNAPYFCVLNSDKSYQDDNDKYQVDESNYENPYSNTGLQILGPGVNTAGTIYTTGYVEGSEVHAPLLFHTPGYLVSGPDTLLRDVSNNLIPYGAGTILANSNITTNANIYSRKMFISGAASNLGTSNAPLTASAGRGVLNGATVPSATIYTSALTSNSLIFATVTSGTAGGLTVVSSNSPAPQSNYFVVYSSITNSTASFNWMIVN